MTKKEKILDIFRKEVSGYGTGILANQLYWFAKYIANSEIPSEIFISMPYSCAGFCVMLCDVNPYYYDFNDLDWAIRIDNFGGGEKAIKDAFKVMGIDIAGRLYNFCETAPSGIVQGIFKLYAIAAEEEMKRGKIIDFKWTIRRKFHLIR